MAGAGRTERCEGQELVQPPRQLRLPGAAGPSEADGEHAPPRRKLRGEQLDGADEDEESLLEGELLRQPRNLRAGAVGARAEAELLLQEGSSPAREREEREGSDILSKILTNSAKDAMPIWERE